MSATTYSLSLPSGQRATCTFSATAEPFADAARSAVRQIKGKLVTAEHGGDNRAFFSALLGLGGLTPKDFGLTVVDDTKILQLARAGDIDFFHARRGGSNVVLINEGASRVFGIGQLVQNLPPGDARVVTALGATPTRRWRSCCASECHQRASASPCRTARSSSASLMSSSPSSKRRNTF
jgi:hypothetical protein